MSPHHVHVGSLGRTLTWQFSASRASRQSAGPGGHVARDAIGPLQTEQSILLRGIKGSLHWDSDSATRRLPYSLPVSCPRGVAQTQSQLSRTLQKRLPEVQRTRTRHVSRCSSEVPAEKPQQRIEGALPSAVAMLGGQSLAERVTAYLVNGGGSGAIGSYVAEPVTWLHSLDPRVKQAWLLMLVALPARSGLGLRFTICALVALLSLLSLPRETSSRQLRQATLLSLLLFVGLAFGSDGIRTTVQARDVPASVEPLASLHFPQQSAPGGGLLGLLSDFLGRGYKYTLFSFGPFQLTRRGAKVGAQAATLSFIILQSAALSLTTTTPEATTSALRWFLLPLQRLGAPVDAVVLSLLLSLRFMGLVFEEVRNLALGVVARGIDWKRLRMLGSVDLVLSLSGRLFQNLFSHADQIAQAMVARGFQGDARRHRLLLLSTTSGLGIADWGALLALVILCIGSWRLGLLQPA